MSAIRLPSFMRSDRPRITLRERAKALVTSTAKILHFPMRKGTADAAQAVDPIFAALAAHTAAYEAHKAAISIYDRHEQAMFDAKTPEERARCQADPEFILADRNSDKAGAQEIEAWKAIFTRLPTTHAGLVALAQHLEAFRRHYDELHGAPGADAFLIQAIEAMSGRPLPPGSPATGSDAVLVELAANYAQAVQAFDAERGRTDEQAGEGVRLLSDMEALVEGTPATSGLGLRAKANVLRLMLADDGNDTPPDDIRRLTNSLIADAVRFAPDRPPSGYHSAAFNGHTWYRPPGDDQAARAVDAPIVKTAAECLDLYRRADTNAPMADAEINYANALERSLSVAPAQSLAGIHAKAELLLYLTADNPLGMERLSRSIANDIVQVASQAPLDDHDDELKALVDRLERVDADYRAFFADPANARADANTTPLYGEHRAIRDRINLTRAGTLSGLRALARAARIADEWDGQADGLDDTGAGGALSLYRALAWNTDMHRGDLVLAPSAPDEAALIALIEEERVNTADIDAAWDRMSKASAHVREMMGAIPETLFEQPEDYGYRLPGPLRCEYRDGKSSRRYYDADNLPRFKKLMPIRRDAFRKPVEGEDGRDWQPHEWIINGNHPWPEAQQRAEEIVAALEQWIATAEKAEAQHDAAALEAAHDAAVDRGAAIRTRIANAPAKSIGAIVLKARHAAEHWGGTADAKEELLSGLKKWLGNDHLDSAEGIGIRALIDLIEYAAPQNGEA